MNNADTRPRPGFISDAEDMLHDIDEIDRLNEGVLTDEKIESIKMFLECGGELVTPEFLSKTFQVSLDDVHRVIRSIGEQEG